MNAVRLSYTAVRNHVGELDIVIERAGHGDDKVEQFIDNLELGIKRLAQSSGCDLHDAERIDEPL